MCRVSEKIKLCTCSVSLARLKNYWVLHRYVEGKLEIMVGEPLMPYPVDERTDIHNKEVLLNRLQEPDAFDVSLNLREQDRLKIAFQCATSYNGYLVYGFEYKGGRWKEIGFESFDWMARHEEAEFGKLKDLRKKVQP